MSAKGKAASPLARLLTLLWRQPLFALPFAAFFGILFGHNWNDYLATYLVSLVFSYCIALGVWGTQFFLGPWIARRGLAAGRNAQLISMSVYFVVSVLSAFVAALIVHLTVVPGFLGSLRSVLIVVIFTLLFAALFIGANLVIHYYRESLIRARADQELNLARRIQRSFLLTQFPALPRIELHAVNLSSREVSGDFYDVVPAGDGSYLLAIADVAGKGVAAALLTSMLQASLRTQAGVTRSVAEILKNINTLVYRSTQENQFATFFLARIEQDTLRLSFSNAGHNYPVVFRDDGHREFLVRGGVVVGILEDARFEEESIELKPGDRLVFYTDGVSEAESPGGELYGEDRLYELISGLPRDLSAREVTDRIVGAVTEFLGGAEAGDDITLMVLRVREPAADPAAAPATP